MSGTSVPYDVAVIGAGPGGYVAAIRAAQLGARVCLIERDKVGGTCLNRGCIPTKSLVASAEAYRSARQAAAYGVLTGAVQPDFSAMSSRSAEVVERLVKGVEFLLKKHKVSLLQGRASFTGAHSLEVHAGGQTEVLSAEKIIIASGSKPVVFPAFGYDGSRVVTSDEVLRLPRLPARVAIIGGGVIGCEFASIFHSLDTQVSVIEALPTLLPLMEKDVAKQLASYFKRRGIDVFTGAKVDTVEKGQVLQVKLSGGQSVECDLVLVAVGRRAYTAGLAIEKAGVALNERGEIIVDNRMRTNVPHIYAIGDVAATPWKLAHVASHQGIVAAHQCAGQDATADYRAIPAVVFTDPEVASVGMTSEAAAEGGIAVNTAKFTFMGIGKAVAEGHTEGFVKILADKKTDQVLGVHIIGPQAATLIAEATLAVQQQITAAQMARTIHAHPTLSEALMEAAHGIHGLAIHA